MRLLRVISSCGFLFTASALNEGEDCWNECHEKGGECDACYSGLCCRQGYADGPCGGTLGIADRYTCTATCWDTCGEGGPCPQACGPGGYCCRQGWDDPGCQGLGGDDIKGHTCVWPPPPPSPPSSVEEKDQVVGGKGRLVDGKGRLVDGKGRALFGKGRALFGKGRALYGKGRFFYGKGRIGKGKGRWNATSVGKGKGGKGRDGKGKGREDPSPPLPPTPPPTHDGKGGKDEPSPTPPPTPPPTHQGKGKTTASPTASPTAPTPSPTPSPTTPRPTSKPTPRPTRKPTPSPTYSRELLQGHSLFVNQLLMSPNHKYMAKLQSDGNFVVYENQGAWVSIWSTKTSDCVELRMQADQHLVCYSHSGVAWKSGKEKVDDDAVYLEMQDDGNLVEYTVMRKVIWSSKD